MSTEETDNQESATESFEEQETQQKAEGTTLSAKVGKLLGKKSVLMERDVELEADTEIEVLKNELKAAKDEAIENYDKYLRAVAELDNSKKRAMKEKTDLMKYQGERIFIDLLEIVDDFERALQFSESNPEQLKSGIELILKRFGTMLTKWEVKGESAVGKQFDPNFHNALSRVPAPGQAAGSIIGELKKPYFYKDKLIRHGDVIVAAEVATEPLENTSDGD